MKIGIAIVNYGAQELLDNCLKSLQIQEHYTSDYDADVKILKSSSAYIGVYDNNTSNIGFTLANNKIISKFLKNDIEWIWLLNNDTTVPPETLQSIEDNLKGLKPEVGVVGFQIRSMDEPDFIHHAGTGDCFPAGIHKSGSVKLKQHQKNTPEKWVTFASVLIRREVFEKIGLLDENMKFICSDSDFCYRARAAGFKVIYEPSFVIYHKIGQSAQSNSSVEAQKRNDIIYFSNKWMSGKLFFDLSKELL